jgi:transposase-like protein
MVDLPPANTNRWVARRKAAVVAALSSGAITMEEACRRYALSEEELLDWQHAFQAHGLAGLRATSLRARRTRRSKPDAPQR